MADLHSLTVAMPPADAVLLAAIALLLAAGASIAVHTLRTGVPPMPTLPTVRRALLAVLPADVHGTVLELGAGWGTLALPLARRYPANAVLALERSPLPWAACRLRAALARLRGTRNLTVHRADFLRANLGADFLRADLRAAGLVVCYLYPAAMSRLAGTLSRALRPGTWIVSHTFALPGWQPLAVHHAPDWRRTPIYVYRVR